MTASVDDGDFIEIGSEYEDGTWSVSMSLGETTILIETTRDDIDSLPVLVNSMNAVLETAWTAIEQKIQEDQP